jgi:predicted PurR-regulated permease PerM
VSSRQSPPVTRIEISARTLFSALGIVVGVWLVVQLKAVLLGMLVSLVLAGTFAPAVEAMERRRVRRGVAIGGIFLAVLGVLIVVGLVTIPAVLRQLQDLLVEAPSLQARLVERLAASRVTAPMAETVRGFRTSTLAAEALRLGVAWSPHAVAAGAYVLTSVVLALYMVADRDRVRAMLFSVFPREHHLRLARILVNLETIVGGYVRGQLLTSLAMALFTFALLTVCRVPNALPVAVFAGLTDVLPFIGGLLALFPAVLASLSRGLVIVVVVLVPMIVYQEIESRVLVPRIYGRVLRLAPVTVLVSLMIGGELLGALGAILALPVAAGLRMIMTEMRVELPGEVGVDPAARESDEVDVTRGDG